MHRVNLLQEDVHLRVSLVRQRDRTALLFFEIRGEHLLKDGGRYRQKGLEEVKLLSCDNECHVCRNIRAFK